MKKALKVGKHIDLSGDRGCEPSTRSIVSSRRAAADCHHVDGLAFSHLLAAPTAIDLADPTPMLTDRVFEPAGVMILAAKLSLNVPSPAGASDILSSPVQAKPMVVLFTTAQPKPSAMSVTEIADGVKLEVPLVPVEIPVPTASDGPIL